jgi:hypothetical protein
VKLIENEGALFRGPTRTQPTEVWSHKDQTWKPYTGRMPKPYEWGKEIDQTEADRMIAEGRPGQA